MQRFISKMSEAFEATNDDHPAPKWLTTDYLEKVLQNYKNDNGLKVKKVKIEPAIPKGENYASVMTRVKLAYEQEISGKSKEQTVSILVKTSNESDSQLAAIFEPYRVFETEMKMYDTVLPKLSAMLQQIGDKDKLNADTIHVDYKNEAIIFEDLAVREFCSADRIAGLDMTLTKMTLKKLAKMHAICAVLNEQTKGSLQKFTRGIFNSHTRNFGPIFENLMTVCADFAGNCPELGKYYEAKLLKLKAHIMEYATRAVELHEGHFHTLNHGDLWTNNIMIRYEAPKAGRQERTVEDLLLIDFQFCNWTSPTIDLHYFLNTSLERKLQLYNQDELVQYYHGILYETLSKLNYAGHIPSLHEFCIQMEATRIHAVTSALVNQSFMINDNPEDADLPALIFNDERARNFQKRLYTNKALQDNVKVLLPYFDKRGLLEVSD